jgi:hypothetical protein
MRVQFQTICIIASLLAAPSQVLAQKPLLQSEPVTTSVQGSRPHEESTEASSSDGGPAVTAALIDIEFRMLSTRNQISDLLKLDTLIDAFLKNRDNLKRAVENARGVDCDKDFAKLNEDYESVSRAVNVYWPTGQELQKSEGLSFTPILGNFFMASPQERCRLLQQEGNRKAIDAAVVQFEETAKSHKAKLADLRNTLIGLESRLQKTLASQGALKVADNLPILISIIAGASIAIMLVIRLFSSELQMEWVASGQVIQFTTVMILLSALMALGLTGILKENTLGTLLGGLAGYVLAQGVGRATARATLNAANAANAGSPGTRPVNQPPPKPQDDRGSIGHDQM